MGCHFVGKSNITSGWKPENHYEFNLDKKTGQLLRNDGLRKNVPQGTNWDLYTYLAN
jgi:hypothetical protein